MRPHESSMPNIQPPSSRHLGLWMAPWITVSLIACQGSPSTTGDSAPTGDPVAVEDSSGEGIVPATADGFARVRVVDPAGNPVERAEWWVSGHEEPSGDDWSRVFYSGFPQHHWTGADGMIEVPPWNGLRYDLYIVAPGFTAAEVHSLEADQMRGLVLTPGLDVTGTVLSSAPGGPTPLAGARVELRKPNPRDRWLQRDLRTDSQGRFRFEGLVDLNPSGSTQGWQLVCADRVIDLEWAANGSEVVPVEIELDEAAATTATTVGLTQDEFRERFEN